MAVFMEGDKENAGQSWNVFQSEREGKEPFGCFSLYVLILCLLYVCEWQLHNWVKSPEPVVCE